MPTRPSRRRTLTVAIIAVVVAVAATGALFAWPSGSTPAAGADADAASTTAVTRQTLTAQTQLTGTLGYAGDVTVIGRLAGTVTALPVVGDVVQEGQQLYAVDGSPVVLLAGDTPAWRTLAAGAQSDDVTGADVRQLNAALVRLGYADGLALDPDSDQFGWATKAAVKRMQAALGLPKTGTLELGRVVFSPTALRVTTLTAGLGGPAEGAVLSATSTDRVVTIALAAAQQAQVAVDDPVTITLPDGTTTPGVVAAVSTVATTGDSPDTGATVTVTVRPTSPEQTGAYDQAPVQVAITTGTAADVLVVPVTSLLALAGGGYAVEVVDSGGAHTLVAVTTGLFDDASGLVEVTGDGLDVGDRVVIPTP